MFGVDFSEVVYASQNTGCHSFWRHKTFTTDYPKFCVGMPVVQKDGWAGARCTVTWLPNFLGRVVYHIFLPVVLLCERFACKSSANNYQKQDNTFQMN